MKKNKNLNDGLVYSTDPDFLKPEPQEQVQTLESSSQNLRVKSEKNGRAGKVVTLVTGFVGNDADFEELAKKIKAFCATGGSTKEGQIIIQGDLKQKIFDYLLKLGYVKVKLL
jgi:translation initiation factor 1